MRHKLTTWINLILAVELALAGLVGLLSTLHESGKLLWSQEAAGWAGATGSVLAVIAALRIASNQTRRLDRQELLRSQLHASAIRLRLVGISHALDTPALELEAVTANTNSPLPFLNCSGQMAAIDIIPLEMIIPLAALPGNAATLLAQAFDGIAMVPKKIEQATRVGRLNTAEGRVAFAKQTAEVIRGQQDFIDQAIEICNSGARALLMGK